jgi:hypothetical protein
MSHDKELIESGAMYGALGGMPGIAAQALSHNHVIPHKYEGIAIAASIVGGAAGTLGGMAVKARKLHLNPVSAMKQGVGSVAGDLVGGMVGAQGGIALSNAASKRLKNPLLRTGAAIIGAIAGDSAAGLVGNLAGGAITAGIKNKVMGMHKVAELFGALESNINILRKRALLSKSARSNAALKSIHGYHPNGNKLALTPEATKKSVFIMGKHNPNEMALTYKP